MLIVTLKIEGKIMFTRLLQSLFGCILLGYLISGAVVLAADHSALINSPEAKNCRRELDQILQAMPHYQGGDLSDFARKVESYIYVQEWDRLLALVPVGDSYEEILAKLFLWLEINQEAWDQNSDAIQQWTSQRWLNNGELPERLSKQMNDLLGACEVQEIVEFIVESFPKIWIHIFQCTNWQKDVRLCLKTTLGRDNNAPTNYDLTFHVDRHRNYDRLLMLCMEIAGIRGFVQQVRWGISDSWPVLIKKAKIIANEIVKENIDIVEPGGAKGILEQIAKRIYQFRSMKESSSLVETHLTRRGINHFLHAFQELKKQRTREMDGCCFGVDALRF